jgi:hypothetical protein
MKDKTIVEMKADKGSSCVIIDREQYKIKVKELLPTGEAFKKMKGIVENTVNKMESKLNYRIYDLKKCKRVSEEDCN